MSRSAEEMRRELEERLLARTGRSRVPPNSNATPPANLSIQKVIAAVAVLAMVGWFAFLFSGGLNDHSERQADTNNSTSTAEMSSENAAKLQRLCPESSIASTVEAGSVALGRRGIAVNPDVLALMLIVGKQAQAGQGMATGECENTLGAIVVDIARRGHP